MFREKPRLRFPGVYISRVNYMRPGLGESAYQVLHMITYFRYLRFFSDGKALMLTSTTEPQHIVRQLSLDFKKEKGFMTGTYWIEDARVHVSMQDVDRPGYVFSYSLNMVPNKRNGTRKLEWGHYSLFRGLQESEIPLDTLKPFHYSKVKAFLVDIIQR